MHQLAEVLGLLEAVPFRADPVTLETVLEGPQAQPLVGHPAGVPLSAAALWETLVVPQDRPQVIAALRAVAESGVARAIEYRALVSGRVLATFKTAVQRLVEPGGATVLRGVMLDVTGARASERQSLEVESWLAALGESLPFDFWICDRRGRFVLQNPASRRRLGNIVGRTVAELPLLEAERALLQAGVDRAVSGERVHRELRANVDGEERVLSRVISPVRGSLDGGPSGALGVDLDVTELKQVEQRLRLSLEELRQTQGELVRRERLAVLGEMAAAVAHEVRNPLGSMCNVVELLRRRAPRSAEEGQLLEILSEELNRLDVLVVNLFDLVRPLQAVLRPQRLESVVDDALADALRSAAHASRIRVVRKLASPPLEASVDGRLFGLALINVMRNAVQAMPDGGDLEVDVAREERGGREWAKVAIRDSGPGIPPELRERIFEPFFTTRSTGSGLGLAIVKRVIAEHQGELEVESKEGQGTAFVLRLPCQRVEAHR